MKRIQIVFRYFLPDSCIGFRIISRDVKNVGGIGDFAKYFLIHINIKFDIFCRIVIGVAVRTPENAVGQIIQT